MDSKLIVAESFLENKKYQQAKEVYTDITDNYSDDYRGWWGLVATATENFTKYNFTATELGEIKENAKTALTLAPDKEKVMIKSKWDEYKNGFKKVKTQKPNTKNLENKATGIQKQLDELNANYTTLKKSLDNAERFTKYSDNENCLPLYILMAVGGLPIILDLIFNFFPGWGKAIYIVLLALVIAPAVIMITARMSSQKTNDTIADLKIAVADIEKELNTKNNDLDNVNEHLEKVAPKKAPEQPRSKQTEYQLKVLQQLYNNKKISYADYKRKKKELLKK